MNFFLNGDKKIKGKILKKRFLKVKTVEKVKKKKFENILKKIKTLPEAQRTQGIESLNCISFWIKLIRNYFGWKISFKLWTQYPGSVVPLAMLTFCPLSPLSPMGSVSLKQLKMLKNESKIWQRWGTLLPIHKVRSPL